MLFLIKLLLLKHLETLYKIILPLKYQYLNNVYFPEIKDLVYDFKIILFDFKKEISFF